MREKGGGGGGIELVNGLARSGEAAFEFGDHEGGSALAGHAEGGGDLPFVEGMEEGSGGNEGSPWGFDEGKVCGGVDEKDAAYWSEGEGGRGAGFAPEKNQVPD